MAGARHRPGWIAYASALTFAVVAGEIVRDESPGAAALTLAVVPAYVAAWRYAYRSPELWPS